MCRENLEFTLGEKDYHDVVRRMRTSDRQEVESVCLSWEQFHRAVFDSDFLVAWRDPEGRVGAIGGVTGHTKYGVIWAVTTDSVEKYPREFHRAARCFVRYVQPATPMLLNFVATTNSAAIAWLEKLGFYVNETSQLYGASCPMPHRLFSWRAAA